MSMFTPGPWTAEFSDCGEIDPRCRGGYRIDGPPSSDPHGYANRADALLIAAAPELYAALEALTAETEHCDNAEDMGVSAHSGVIRAARAALAKADGGK